VKLGEIRDWLLLKHVDGKVLPKGKSLKRRWWLRKKRKRGENPN